MVDIPLWINNDASTVLLVSLQLLGLKQHKVDASTFQRSNPSALEHVLHFLHAQLNSKDVHKKVLVSELDEWLCSTLHIILHHTGFSWLLAHHLS